MKSEQVPELITEPANLDEWVTNRTDILRALLDGFRIAAESGNLAGCKIIATSVGHSYSVIAADLAVIAGKTIDQTQTETSA